MRWSEPIALLYLHKSRIYGLHGGTHLVAKKAQSGSSTDGNCNGAQLILGTYTSTIEARKYDQKNTCSQNVQLTLSYTTKYTFGEASQDHPIQLATASNLIELSSRIVEKTLSSGIASNDSFSCSNPGFDFPNLPSLRLIVTRVNLRFVQAESAKRITPISKLHLRISLRWDIETEFFFREIIVFVDSTEFTHCKRPTW